jgi:hypothetical protein
MRFIEELSWFDKSTLFPIGKHLMSRGVDEWRALSSENYSDPAAWSGIRFYS